MKAYDLADKKTGKRQFRFLDGSIITAEEDACRGCMLNDPTYSFPVEIQAVYEDKDIVVRQDAEWPVPGFYVVGIKEHIASIDLLGTEVYTRMMLIIRAVRLVQKKYFRIDHVHTVQEEKLRNAHLHYWLIPLWKTAMEKNNINPRLYESNIIEYFELFSYEKERFRIMEFSEILKKQIRSFL